ncbi:MAG: hypothetical protein A4E49_00280 [Methanosaeta sp. PtaU1.Bin112]|nr:MAG: hypothetical protein A4E49_00280 [Methanosaeta sp. PtaU1.Bin112]
MVGLIFSSLEWGRRIRKMITINDEYPMFSNKAT